jgi:signal recognition particle receptor subunit beta
LDLEGGRVPVPVSIWDTAGQERFRSVPTSLARDADAGILVFALDNEPSFASLPQWLSLLTGASPATKVLVVGNKEDLVLGCSAPVPREKIEEWINEHGFVYIAMSAKTGMGCNEGRNALRELLLEQVILNGSSGDQTGKVLDLNEKRLLLCC